MHYDLRTDAELAWASFPYFVSWGERVGDGDCGFVRTGFLQLVPDRLADALRSNVAMHQDIGIATQVVEAAAVADLVPGVVTDDIAVAAYEPGSGYADPAGTCAGFIAAAARRRTRLVQDRRAVAVLTEGDRWSASSPIAGRYAAPVVVDVAGAWAAEARGDHRGRRPRRGVAPRHGVFRPAGRRERRTSRSSSTSRTRSTSGRRAAT